MRPRTSRCSSKRRASSVLRLPPRGPPSRRSTCGSTSSTAGGLRGLRFPACLACPFPTGQSRTHSASALGCPSPFRLSARRRQGGHGPPSAATCSNSTLTCAWTTTTTTTTVMPPRLTPEAPQALGAMMKIILFWILCLLPPLLLGALLGQSPSNTRDASGCAARSSTEDYWTLRMVGESRNVGVPHANAQLPPLFPLPCSSKAN